MRLFILIVTQNVFSYQFGVQVVKNRLPLRHKLRNIIPYILTDKENEKIHTGLVIGIVAFLTR